MDMSKKIQATRLEIDKEMQMLIDLENDLCTNAQNTEIRNIVGVRSNDGVDVITMSSKDFKCSQCAYQKQTCGAVETHMHEMHGIGGFDCMFCNKYTTSNSHSLYVHCTQYHNININGVKLKI